MVSRMSWGGNRRMGKNEKEFGYQDTAVRKYKKMEDRKERRNEKIRK